MEIMEMNAAASRTAGRLSWVVDLEMSLDDIFTRWGSELTPGSSRHSVYRVPASVKNLQPLAYQPQVVSLGPFHHGEAHLVPMEEHKRRAVLHVVRRARRPVDEFVAAVESVAWELEGAYQDLGDEWRSEKFLRMMVMDGCFLLEVMRTTTGTWGWESSGWSTVHAGYQPDDPVFSRHGAIYTAPYVRRDMLIMENQLPLLLLDRLVAVERSVEDGRIEDTVRRMVLRFVSPSMRTPPPVNVQAALHPLDLFRKSMLRRQHSGHHRIKPPMDGAVRAEDAAAFTIRSATELHEMGIRFRRNGTDSLLDIRFRRGVLLLPAIAVDDTTEHIFLNLMAFERLHPGAGNDVSAFVFLMDSLIRSSRDVELLSIPRIIQNAVGGHRAVAAMFDRLSRYIVLDPESEMDYIYTAVNSYCRSRWRLWDVWFGNLVNTYFRSPWTFLSLAGAVSLLAMTVVQTIFTVLQFYHR
uniref:Uncharacterized protein n=1 Tax=Oryza glumipatula TaxID=40148 RepID=A0A0E0BSQ9_9ORYZ